MNLKEIERLMAAMQRAGMHKVVLKQEGFELELEKDLKKSAVALEEPPDNGQIENESPLPEPLSTRARSQEVKEGRYVLSPMVGTFYVAPSPKDAPFVKIGDEIHEGKIVCIIEAMKVMNEIKSTVKGKLVEILVRNGEPVEFGMKLFRVV